MVALLIALFTGVVSLVGVGVALMNASDARKVARQAESHAHAAEQRAAAAEQRAEQAHAMLQAQFAQMLREDAARIRTTDRQRDFLKWTEQVREKLRSGPNNFYPVADDEREAAQWAVEQGLLAWDPSPGEEGVMLPGMVGGLGSLG